MEVQRGIKHWDSTISYKPSLREIFLNVGNSRASFRLEVTNSNACRGPADNINECFWLAIKQLWVGGWGVWTVSSWRVRDCFKGAAATHFQPIVFPRRNAGNGQYWRFLRKSQKSQFLCKISQISKRTAQAKCTELSLQSLSRMKTFHRHREQRSVAFVIIPFHFIPYLPLFCLPVTLLLPPVPGLDSVNICKRNPECQSQARYETHYSCDKHLTVDF